MDIYVHSPIHLHGVVLNKSSTGTLPIFVCMLLYLHHYIKHVVSGIPTAVVIKSSVNVDITSCDLLKVNRLF
jgi:hypothetical protein